MGLLEEECMQRIALHKFSILKAMMMRYYETLEQGQVDIPEFCKDSYSKHRIELLANRDIRDLVCLGDNLQKFNSLYEKAYAELAPLLN